MSNCPVCGRDVPAGTQYCPSCGTNLQQTYGSPTTAAPSYSFPQSGTGMPEPNQHHGHGKYIIAIAVALIIGLVIGGVIGFSFPVAAHLTPVNGIANLNSQQTTPFHGTPNLVWFNSTTFGNLTSTVISHKFLVNLPIGDTYYVSIQWFNTTGTYRCIPTTSTFTSNNQNESPIFSC